MRYCKIIFFILPMFAGCLHFNERGASDIIHLTATDFTLFENLASRVFEERKMIRDSVSFSCGYMDEYREGNITTSDYGLKMLYSNSYDSLLRAIELQGFKYYDINIALDSSVTYILKSTITGDIFLHWQRDGGIYHDHELSYNWKKIEPSDWNCNLLGCKIHMDSIIDDKWRYRYFEHHDF